MHDIFVPRDKGAVVRLELSFSKQEAKRLVLRHYNIIPQVKTQVVLCFAAVPDSALLFVSRRHKLSG